MKYCVLYVLYVSYYEGALFCYIADPANAICLESVKLPGQHVGVLPSGDTKAPSNTGRGPHGSFTVELVQAVSFFLCSPFPVNIFAYTISVAKPI